MGYHDAVGAYKRVVRDAYRFVNDRARLEIGFRRMLEELDVPASDRDRIIADVRSCNMDSLHITIKAIKAKIPERCAWHPVKNRGYLEDHMDAEERIAAGQVQIRCKTCRLYFWIDEFGEKPKEEQPNGQG